MTKININENCYLMQDEYSFQPFYLKKGGEEVRNPKTGEIIISQDKFVSTNTYHNTLEGAIKELAKYETLKQGEYDSLSSYVNAYNNAYNFLRNCITL